MRHVPLTRMGLAGERIAGRYRGGRAPPIGVETTYDQAIPSSDYVNNSGATEASGVTTKATLDATHYCVYSQVGNWFAWKLNPDGSILQGTTAAHVCTATP